jgi:gamma-glutamylcyclotransferase (GGCT)/AIG2-like uncharacterized protein YtfP
MEGEYLFVYGTLRQGIDNLVARNFKCHSEYLGFATIKATLYNVGHYPALVESKQYNDKVVGELYRLNDASATLSELDDYEECSLYFDHPHEYKRVIRKVQLINGLPFKSWIYIYNRSVESLALITSGDYLEFLSNPSRRQ